MKEKLNYFNWTLGSWYFWLGLIVWFLFSGINILIEGSIGSAMGILAGEFFMLMILSGIFYLFYKKGYNDGKK